MLSLIFNGQITYGDVAAIVITLGIIAVVMLGGVLIATTLLSRKK